jgi:tetratricopeptide (TPR) repeat protein
VANALPPNRQAQAVAWREAGIAAARAGQKVRAQRYLRQSIALDDGVEETWLWLAGVAATPQESERCLRRALAINPHSERARAGLQWAQRRLAAATQRLPARSRSYRWAYWVGAVLAVWLLVLLVGGFLLTTLGTGNPISAVPRPTPTDTPVPGTPTPTTLQQIETLHALLQTAGETKDWSECISILGQIQVLDSNYAGLDEWFIAVHLAWGLELADQKQLEEAVVHFDAVRALDRNEQVAQEQRLLALAYLAAQKSYVARNWDRATSQLEAVLGLDDDYHDAKNLLYQAYYQQGLAHQAAGELRAAQKAYEQALAVKNGEEAQVALAQVVLLLTPPTPTPAPKRIEVYIGQQRMYVYEGEHLIWDWIVSTGEPGRDTHTGHFEVLDKIPNAYASRWDLQMPYWLGIYYVGVSENGIHALPILSNGQRLWEGFLGQRVSYGCVILGTEEARLLYEWAEVGTPVDIYP